MKDQSKIDRVIKNIEIAFIGVQDYILYSSIKLLTKQYIKNDYEVEKTYENFEKLRKKLRQVNFTLSDRWKLFSLDDRKILALNKANPHLKKSFEKIMTLTSIKIDIENDNLGYDINFQECPLQSEEYIKKYIELMDVEYKLGRFVIYDMFRRKGKHYECSTTDLRDALDHLVKSLFMNHNKAIEELICAKEHVRRAAVETLQDYVVTKLNQKISLLQKKDINDVQTQKHISEIQQNICFGRYNKSNKTWDRSVLKFYKALDQIENWE